MLEADENVPNFLMQKQGVNIPQLKRQLDEAIATYPEGRRR
jgi:hypothetical protein